MMYASSPRASLATLFMYTSSLSESFSTVPSLAVVTELPEAGCTLKSTHAITSRLRQAKTKLRSMWTGENFFFSSTGASTMGGGVNSGTGGFAAFFSALILAFSALRRAFSSFGERGAGFFISGMAALAFGAGALRSAAAKPVAASARRAFLSIMLRFACASFFRLSRLKSASNSSKLLPARFASRLCFASLFFAGFTSLMAGTMTVSSTTVWVFTG